MAARPSAPPHAAQPGWGRANKGHLRRAVSSTWCLCFAVTPTSPLLPHALPEPFPQISNCRRYIVTTLLVMDRGTFVGGCGSTTTPWVTNTWLDPDKSPVRLQCLFELNLAWQGWVLSYRSIPTGLPGMPPAPPAVVPAAYVSCSLGRAGFHAVGAAGTSPRQLAQHSTAHQRLAALSASVFGFRAQSAEEYAKHSCCGPPRFLPIRISVALGFASGRRGSSARRPGHWTSRRAAISCRRLAGCSLSSRPGRIK